MWLNNETKGADSSPRSSNWSGEVRKISPKEVGPEKSCEKNAWKLMGHYMVQSPGKLLPACECYHTALEPWSLDYAQPH